MEWVVTEMAPSGLNSGEVLRVDAGGNLTFIIWVVSNFPLLEGHILTPVIDGYIANHNKAHFVSITKAVPYTITAWNGLTKPICKKSPALNGKIDLVE